MYVAFKDNPWREITASFVAFKEIPERELRVIRLPPLGELRL
jgi:hypothetical protein